MSNLQRLEKELDFLAELNAMIKIRLALCTEEIKDIFKEDEDDNEWRNNKQSIL